MKVQSLQLGKLSKIVKDGGLKRFELVVVEVPVGARRVRREFDDQGEEGRERHSQPSTERRAQVLACLIVCRS